MRLPDGKKILNSTQIIIYLKFECDYADECDRYFVLNRLEWLFNAKFNQLESNIRSLLITDDHNTGSCIDYENNTEQLCPGGICSFFYKPSTNNSNGTCEYDDHMITELRLTSYITTDKDIAETEEKNQDIQSQVKITEIDLTIKYWCQTNNCNNRTTAELIIQAVNDQFDIETMYELINVNNEGDSKSEQDTTSELETATTQLETTTTQLETTTTQLKTTTTSTPDFTTTTKVDITTLMTTTGSTNVTITTASETTTTKSIATSFPISIIMIILNALLLFFN